MDPRLTSYVEASNEPAAERVLEALLENHVEPVVRGIVRSRISSPADIEDVQSDVILELIVRLRTLRGASGEPIVDLAGYAATMAYNACAGHVRRAHPKRARLSVQVRQALEKDSRLAIWRTESGQTVGGLARWTGRAGVRPFADPDLPGAGVAALAELMVGYFHGVGAPVELNHVVDAVARITGVRDEPAESLSASSTFTETELPSLAPGPQRAAESLLYARKLWEEVQKLPVAQRVALLLNLKDDAILLLPVTGVASIRQIAAALGMPAEDLAAIWNDLPLDDNTLAYRLRITRQQVINLRMAARKRLAHRLSDWR
ncbi:MAG: hypothetical protein ACKV22_40895 [Bryobacteraceae bacterium]